MNPKAEHTEVTHIVDSMGESIAALYALLRHNPDSQAYTTAMGMLETAYKTLKHKQSLLDTSDPF